MLYSGFIDYNALLSTVTGITIYLLPVSLVISSFSVSETNDFFSPGGGVRFSAAPLFPILTNDSGQIARWSRYNPQQATQRC